MKFIRLIPFIILILFLSGCSLETSPDPLRVKEGVLDLTEWDINHDNIIRLDGQWEFYWERFVNGQELSVDNLDTYLEVPSTWNQSSINGKRLTGQGYGTYRLRVKTSLPEGTMLGIRIYPLSSAYEFYVNEKLIAANGKVASVKKEEIGEYRPQTIFFNIPAEEFDLIVHISNFQYARGGFWYSVSMGSVEDILNLHDNIMGKEFFLIGALLIISLFYFAVYFLRRELRYSLYFASLCISMVIALDMMGQYILLRIFPGLSLKSVLFIAYSSMNWSLFLLIIFVHALFKSRFSIIILKIYFCNAIMWQLLYIFTPAIVYTRFALTCDIIGIIGITSTVIMVCIHIKQGQKDGLLYLLSIVVVLAAYIHDVLFLTNRIDNPYGEMIYFGLFIFLFLEIVIQANRIKRFHDHKTAAELSFLQAQIKPHFLYNAINTFVSISRYDMDQARGLLINFSNYLRRSFDFKDLSQTVSLKDEVELAKAYAAIEKARFEERLEVNFEICDDLEVKVPILMLQPVIENAVNHGVLPKSEGGRIDISVKRDGRLLVFSVKDNGVGMKDEKKLFYKREFGSGVGLANIDSRLKKLYGKGLQISSSLNLGTEVIWHIPTNRMESD